MKQVVNLKRLNEWVKPQHFKMEGIGTLKELLRVNDWWSSKMPTSQFQSCFNSKKDWNTISSHACHSACHVCTLGIHQGNETSDHLPTEHVESAFT